MFVNTGILQILAQTAHNNIVALTEQNKPELIHNYFSGGSGRFFR